MSYPKILALTAIAAAVTSCAVPTVSTTPAKSPGPASSAPPAVARTGDTIRLAGNSAGEKMAVTVVKVIPDGHGTEFNTPQKGDRYVAVQFRLADTGTIAYSDSPGNGATVTDRLGQSNDSWIGDVAGCPSFPAAVRIAIGTSGLGCIMFQMPKAAKITQVQFTLDSGFADQTGQWKV